MEQVRLLWLATTARMRTLLQSLLFAPHSDEVSRKTLHIKRHQWVFSNVNPLSGCNAGLKYINRTPSRLTSQVERYGHKQERRREEREPASCVGTTVGCHPASQLE